MKTVSICIPAYEQPENLDKCLTSIVNQTFKDFEVIITDDSKTNSVELIVDKYKNILNIIYIKNLVSKGSPENWNEAICHATGQYIKILHHDDRFKDNHSLQKFVELIDEHHNIDAVFCSSHHVNQQGEYVSSHILNDKKMELIKKDSRYLFFGNQIGAPSIMLYKNGLDITFDKRMKWLVDIDFYIRLLKNRGFAYTKEELISINIGEEQRVTNSCIFDRKINIYETMILFDKFKMKNISLRYKKYFLYLFLKFNILSSNDIKEMGYKDSIHVDINKLFWIVRILLPFYNFLLNVKNNLKKWL